MEADPLRRPPRGFWFDAEEAERVVRFIEENCRHHKGEWAGQPLTLEDWQKDDVIRPLFGWKRADGTRRFRTAYIEIPRKNGKSEIGAAVGTLLAFADDEPGAEVYASATKEDQAKIVWGTAKEMVKQSPELREYVTIRRKTLSCEELGSKFEPLGSDSDTLDGLNVHGNIVDEMHAHKDGHLLNVLVTATGARRQPLTFIITTAGVYNPESPGWEQHEYAVRVLEGAIEDDSYFAYIAAADEADDFTDPETWRKANPNLGVSVKEDYLAEQCRAAENKPSYLNTFLRYHLNRWVEQTERWIPVEAWNACDATPIALESLRGRTTYGALDLSTKLDITALTLALPAADGFFDLLFRFWVPEALVEQRAREKQLPDYSAWVRDGWLKATPGNVIDYDFIREEVKSLASVVTLKELGFDPWNATQLATQLSGDGLTLVEMRQGPRTLSEPSKEFEKLVVARKVRHGGHPVMRWMVSNAVIRRDANDNIAPDKRSASGKIDGVVSTIMALGRAIVQPALVASVYETRGIEFL